MINFEQEMKEHYAKLEQNMKTVESLFNFKKKGYLGENVMLLDFSPKAFDEAAATVAAFDKPNDNGWTNYKGIDFRLVAYPKNNRIALTF
jgi:hypothetical protein